MLNGARFFIRNVKFILCTYKTSIGSGDPHPAFLHRRAFNLTACVAITLTQLRLTNSRFYKLTMLSCGTNCLAKENRYRCGNQLIRAHRCAEVRMRYYCCSQSGFVVATYSWNSSAHQFYVSIETDSPSVWISFFRLDSEQSAKWKHCNMHIFLSKNI